MEASALHHVSIILSGVLHVTFVTHSPRISNTDYFTFASLHHWQVYLIPQLVSLGLKCSGSSTPYLYLSSAFDTLYSPQQRSMQTLLSVHILAALASLVTSTEIDPYVESYHSAKNSLEKRQAQFIINPCPEFFGDPPQYCSNSRCGGDTKELGVW